MKNSDHNIYIHPCLFWFEVRWVDADNKILYKKKCFTLCGAISHSRYVKRLLHNEESHLKYKLDTY